MTDLSPKRGQRPLHHPEIPRPGRLRGATPEIVLNDFTALLNSSIRWGRLPAGVELYAAMGDFERRLEAAENAEFQQTGLILGLSHSSTRAFTSHALGGRIMLGPDWYADAASPDLMQRAFAFHTYAHEKFHAHRLAPLTHIVSIEEGLAELFAAQTVQKHLGLSLPGTRIYATAKERAHELALLLGRGDERTGLTFLLKSRGADDLPKWLYETGLKRGIPKEQLLPLIFKPEEWQKFLARGGK